jgi:hypothetical protein
MVKNFIYEDFHPNHQMDIEEICRRFMGSWSEMQFHKDSIELCRILFAPNGIPINRVTMIKKLKNMFDSFEYFSNFKYSLDKVSFDWNEKKNIGAGEVEGMVRYDAKLDKGEIIKIEGPFKLFLSSGGPFWQIYKFNFPGFNW